MGAPYIYDISRLRVKDLHSATYIYVVRRLRVNLIFVDPAFFSLWFMSSLHFLFYVSHCDARVANTVVKCLFSFRSRWFRTDDSYVTKFCNESLVPPFCLSWKRFVKMFMLHYKCLFQFHWMDLQMKCKNSLKKLDGVAVLGAWT